MHVDCTYFPPREKARGKRFTTTWERLCARLTEASVAPEKGDAAGISLATFRGDHRLLANVERVFAVGLDLDHLDAVSVFAQRAPGEIVEAHDLSRLRGRFAGVAAFVHTTWSSTLDAPRCRVFFLLSRPVTGAEYPRIYQAIARDAERGGLVVDRAASDASRFWFLPSVRAVGCSMVSWRCDGPPIDVDAALLTVPAPAPPPAPPPRERRDGDDRVFERASRWLAQRDPAIQGSGGDKHTFETACAIVRGFDLDDASAYRLLCDWNLTCRPPWDEHGLRRKIREARERGRMPFGALRDARRSA
ncbi:MAG: hypothetical protein JWP97_5750 [Labilithrix sp.]|nr:hypothetical protein [Labilithrix sp.]